MFRIIAAICQNNSAINNKLLQIRIVTTYHRKVNKFNSPGLVVNSEHGFGRSGMPSGGKDTKMHAVTGYNR